VCPGTAQGPKGKAEFRAWNLEIGTPEMGWHLGTGQPVHVPVHVPLNGPVNEKSKTGHVYGNVHVHGIMLNMKMCD
jgi:hypothetical protein